ncbi:hypothetical protein CIPAW_04G136900 [Carya illinoinensis]|uniref:Uncharacterized protein n=1 Tax=Carya illinoinensis TaxID=32201 RepID=A0A8T1QT03_CARIL|nr:hypothetical protein CIPAW_04G136900 [Carya illinoinensis]
MKTHYQQRTQHKHGPYTSANHRKQIRAPRDHHAWQCSCLSAYARQPNGLSLSVWRYQEQSIPPSLNHHERKLARPCTALHHCDSFPFHSKLLLEPPTSCCYSKPKYY